MDGETAGRQHTWPSVNLKVKSDGQDLSSLINTSTLCLDQFPINLLCIYHYSTKPLATSPTSQQNCPPSTQKKSPHQEVTKNVLDHTLTPNSRSLNALLLKYISFSGLGK